MSKLFTLPKEVILTNAGALIPGAKAYFYAAGTASPQSVYTEYTLTTPHSDPVLADGNGRFPTIYMDPTLDYKVQITDAADVEIYTQDYIFTGVSQDDIAETLNPRTAEEISAGVTPTNYEYQPGDVRRYGATGDGVTDDEPSISNAILTGHAVYIPAGTYILGDELTVTSANNGLLIYGDGPASILKLEGGVATNYRAILLSDASTAIDGITIRDLALDGNRSNRTSTATRGIWANGAAGTYAKNITVSNITAYGFDITGIDLDCESANISNVYSHDNGFHGLATNSTNTSGVGNVINISNAHFFDNDGTGMDISSGNGDEFSTFNVVNVRAQENAQGGIKIACNGIINLSNILSYKNTGKGIRSSNGCRVLNLENVICKENTDDSLDISADSVPNWAISTAYALNDIVENDSGKFYICVTAGTSAGSGGPTGRDDAITDNTVTWDYFPMYVNINNFQSNECGSVGFLSSCGEISMSNVQILDATGQGMVIDTNTQKFNCTNFRVERSGDSNAQIDAKAFEQSFVNGYVGDSASSRSFRLYSPCSISHTVLNDTNGINSNNMSSGDKLTLIDVDFTLTGGTDISDTATPDVNVIACPGYVLGTYTPTNVVTDRSYDANSTTADELADVLGTLIADLQGAGIIE